MESTKSIFKAKAIKNIILCNKIFNFKPDENNLNDFEDFKHMNEFGKGFRIPLFFKMFKKLELDVKSHTRKKNIFMTHIHSKIHNKTFENISDLNIKIKECALLNEMHFLQIYPNLYPKNPPKKVMIKFIKIYDPDNYIFKKNMELEIKNWKIRFDYIINFYNSLADMKFLVKAKKAVINKKNLSKIINNYYEIPKAYYQFTKSSELKKYICKFNIDSKELSKLYKTDNINDIDSEKCILQINFNNFIGYIPEINNFRKNPGNNNKEKLYIILVKYFLLPPIKYITKDYMSSLIDNKCAFFPIKDSEKILKNKYLPPARKFMQKNRLYEEANLICKKILGKPLGYNFYHIPNKNWLYKVILILTKTSILTLDDSQEELINNKSLDYSSDQDNNNNSESEEEMEYKIKKLRSKKLRMYTDNKLFMYYRNRIVSGGYFFFSKNCLNDVSVIYNISDFDTDDNESQSNASESKSKKNFLSSEVSSSEKDEDDQNKKKELKFKGEVEQLPIFSIPIKKLKKRSKAYFDINNKKKGKI